MSMPDAVLDHPGATPASRNAAATYDVVIVGGGSAGAVLAWRLSERVGRRVLLLEANHAHGPWAYPSIVSSSDLVGDITGVDWGDKTEPGWIGRPIGATRGRVLGGSSAINGAVAIRARPQGLRNWNLPGWSYEDLLPAFRRLEGSDATGEGIHGQEGLFPARQMTRGDITPMQNAFMDAAVANGFKVIDDFDGPDVDGVGPYPMNIANGVRMNTGMTYLSNAVRARPNLDIRGDVLVNRIVFGRSAGPRRCSGVGQGDARRLPPPDLDGPHGIGRRSGRGRGSRRVGAQRDRAAGDRRLHLSRRDLRRHERHDHSGCGAPVRPSQLRRRK